MRLVSFRIPLPTLNAAVLALCSVVITLPSVELSDCSDDNAVFWLVVYCDSAVAVELNCTACAAPSGLSAGVLSERPLEIS